MASGSALAAFSCEDSPALIWVAKTYAVPPMLVISPSTGVVIVNICVPVVETNKRTGDGVNGTRPSELGKDARDYGAVYALDQRRGDAVRTLGTLDDGVMRTNC